jgi:formyltetrahydrofolate deformylase
LDEPGILASIAGGLARLECNVTESAQFADASNGRFFLRVVFTAPRGLDCDYISRSLNPVFVRFSMTAAINPAEARMRALVMVSKAGHCLNDLLYRRSCGELSVEIVGIASNHETLCRLAESHSLPFHRSAYLCLSQYGDGVLFYLITTIYG